MSDQKLPPIIYFDERVGTNGIHCLDFKNESDVYYVRMDCMDLVSHENANEVLLEAIEVEKLSKREYFAGLAMQGILSSRGLQQALNADRDNWIEYAVRMADELLLQLSKSN